MDDLQELIEKIRRNVVAEQEQKFADETFQYLRYSIHNGRMRNADTFACLTGENGESMEVYLRFRKNGVEEASYVTDGGPASCLCGSCVAELSIGKTPRQLLEMSAADVLKRVQRAGEGVETSAVLVVETLHKAVEKHWITNNTDSDLPKKKSRNTQFIAVGQGYNHMQYSN